MHSFYPIFYKGENRYGNKITYCFISKRLGGFIQKHKNDWLFTYFDLKPFTIFDKEYMAILISSNGLILLVRYDLDFKFKEGKNESL